MDEFVISFEELCNQLQIGRSAAYTLLNSGKIPVESKIGRIWKIRKNSVAKYRNQELSKTK